MGRREDINECKQYLEGLSGDLSMQGFKLDSATIRDFVSVFLAIHTRRLSDLTKQLKYLTFALLVATVILLVSSITNIIYP